MPFPLPAALRALTLLLIALSGSLLTGAPDTRRPPTDFTAAELTQGYSDLQVLAQPRAPSGEHNAAAEVALAAAEAAEGFNVERAFARFGGLRVLRLPAQMSPAAARAHLLATGRYTFVEPDHILQTAAVPNDPAFTDGSQWHLRNTGQTGGTVGADIDAVAGWDVRTDASNIIVAVIDSGARLTHQDLAPNLWTNPGETAGNGRDDDNNGYIDDVHGINARIALRTAGNGDPGDDDDSGHGTHVAGIVGAAGNNGVGSTGVAWKVQLMPLKFLGGTEGTGATSDAIECIDYAIAKGAKVINASYGAIGADGSFSQAHLEAVRRARDAGVIFVAAAGNDALNLDLTRAYPAAFEVDNMITVGNSTRLDDISPSSNTAAGLVDLFAPGSEIVSTSSANDSAVRTLSGTSMAAPLVTGAVALLRAQYPQDDYRDTINRLLRGAERRPAFEGRAQTGARLSLAGAFAANDTRPFNDDFADRARLAGTIIAVRASSRNATSQTGEPAHAGRLNRSLWFTWTAPAGGLVSIDTRGSIGDTQLAVYTGDTLGSLVRVAENDHESAGFLTSRLTFNATLGTAYQIAVDGTTAGLVMVNLTSAAANDAFDSAQELEGDAPLVTTTNGSATREPGEPAHIAGANGKSLWYRWQAPHSGRFQVSAYSAVADTVLAVYTGTRVNALTLVGNNDDSGVNSGNFNALVDFEATADTVYHIAVDTFGSAAGEITLSVTDAVWQFATGDVADDDRRRPTITNVPAVGPDGTVYVSSADFYFYALNPDGTLRWRVPTEGYSDSSAAAIAPDGTIHFGTFNGSTLYALNPDGTTRWSASPGTSGFVAPPAVAADGTVYFKEDNGTLYAYSPAGVPRWTYTVTGTGSYAGPGIAADGAIHLPANDGALHVLEPSGTLRWRHLPRTADGADDASGIYTSPAFDAEGNVYAATLNGTVFSLTAGGTLRWVYRTTGAGENISSSLALGDGQVYFASYGAYLYALRQSDGSEVWRASIEAQARASSPAIAADGSVVVGSYANKLFRFSRDGELLRAWSAGNWFRSSPTLADGRIYIGNGDGKVYAFDLDGVGPAAGPAYPWPQYRHGPRRLGRATVESIGRVIAPVPADPGRLINLSVRNRTTAGGGVLTAGFVLQGAVAKPLVIRAIGPTLEGFGVDGALSAAELQIYRAAAPGAPLATNRGWSGGANADGRDLGAFALAAGSRDSVVRRNFDADVFTAQALPDGEATAPGVALVEIYDGAVDELRTRLTNLSARTGLAANGDVTLGFVLGGQTPRTLLLRAVGPGLQRFIGDGFLADPQVLLLTGQTGEVGNDDWNGDAVRQAAATVGAFELETGSRDAALITTLPPGAYTARVTAPAGQSGIVLVEVYLLPED